MDKHVCNGRCALHADAWKTLDKAANASPPPRGRRGPVPYYGTDPEQFRKRYAQAYKDAAASEDVGLKGPTLTDVAKKLVMVPRTLNRARRKFHLPFPPQEDGGKPRRFEGCPRQHFYTFRSRAA